VLGLPRVDRTAGSSAVESVLLAVYGCLSGQGGANIDVSLMAAAASLMCGGFTEYLASGRVPPRQGNQNSQLAPAGAFRVAGGRYITVAVLRDSHWQKFCAALGLEQLANDARFATNAARVAHRSELHALITPLFESQPAEFWLEKLRATDILCGPINTLADVLADPALAACLPLIDTGLPNAAQALGAPIRYNGEFFNAERAAPAKGQHTREVLAEIGYTTDEIEGFLQAGSAFTEAGGA